MKKSVKIAIGVGAASIVGYLLFKTNAMVNAMKQLEYSVGGIRAIQLDLENVGLKAKADIVITNPTAINLGISTASLIKLKQIRLFSNTTNKQIGAANVNMDSFAIPAYGTTTLKDIPISVGLMNGVLGVDASNLSTEIVLEAFGKEFLYQESFDMLSGADPANCAQLTM